MSTAKTPTLHDRLRTSVSVQSLKAEQELAALLQKHRWNVSHGWFYADPNTEKIRELDVSARKGWWRKSSRDQFAGVNILCEVKTARDFHLVFAPDINTHRRALVSAHRSWIGFNKKEFAKALEHAAAAPDDVLNLLKDFDELSLTKDEMLVASELMVDPSEASFSSSAYRETNIGGDRELEASVLWKGMQAALSAMASMKARFVEYRLDDIVGPVEWAHRLDRSVRDMVRDELEEALHRVEHYQAVVVIDAKLWALERARLREIPWCRFFLAGTDHPELWCDVVNRSQAANYFGQITRHYNKQFRSVNARRTPPRSN